MARATRKASNAPTTAIITTQVDSLAAGISQPLYFTNTARLVIVATEIQPRYKLNGTRTQARSRTGNVVSWVRIICN